MLAGENEVGTMPKGGRLPSLSIAVAVTLVPAAVLADDVEAFLAGTSRICVACDLGGHDLKERDFKRVKLERANLKGADLTSASLFRATLIRADLSGATLKDANLNLVDGKWADFSGAD